MADVLIVCVREDETQAKALADMFEAAGFSVGGAPSSDPALRSSGAGVVVWSQASIRSRPFLDAAQRVINAGKGVLACLIEPPPSDSVNNSPAFDLSGWDGDANDPSLDPLFFAVDRMVNAARAAVGAASTNRAEPETYESPHLRSPGASTPPYARARTAPPTAQPPQTSMPPGFQMRTRAPEPNDPLGGEAEHWRAIRHSKDPTDFLDYLARYGADGAFAELAEFRLKQLEGSQNQNSLRDAARAASSEPARAYDPPPRRRPEPRPEPRNEPRAYEPPPRRLDPPPPPARMAPPPPPPPRRQPNYQPNYEGDYRPPIDRSDEPRKQGGGFLRMLVLLVLLAGGAVGAGVYFGLGDRLQALTAQQPQAETPQPQLAGGEPASASPTETPGNIPEAAVVDQAQSTPISSPARQRPAEVASNSADDAVNAAAPPQTSWSSSVVPSSSPPYSTGSTGPVSLLPSTQSPSAGQGVVAQTAPPPTTFAANNPPSVATSASSPLSAPAVLWAQRPNGDRLAQTYPSNALRQHLAGGAVLDCVVRADLGVTCAVSSETPAGSGFGRAALIAVDSYRARAVLSDGSTAVGAHTRIGISYRPPAD